MPDFQAIFFSADCVLRSGNALSTPTAEGATWTASPHSGTIALPNGSEIPAGVTSFASGKKGEGFAVVMALDRIVGPSWKRHAFGDGARTVLEMMDDALAGD